MFLLHRSPGQDWLGALIATPKPWATQLTGLRLSLSDLRGSRMPTHVTILPPTPFPTGGHPEMIRHPCEVAKHHSPFRATLRGSNSLHPLSQVVFSSLSEGAAECANLANEVRTGPLDIEQRLPYRPYVALAQDMDDPALDLTLDFSANFRASQLVPGFHLDRVDENGMCSTMALFGLEASSIQSPVHAWIRRQLTSLPRAPTTLNFRAGTWPGRGSERRTTERAPGSLLPTS